MIKVSWVILLVALMLLAGCADEQAPLPGENGEEEVVETNDENEIVPDEEKEAELPPEEIEYGDVLTEISEAVIRDYVAPFEGMFEIYTMVEKDNVLEVWIDVGPDPITDEAVQGLAEGLIQDLVALFNGELALRLTVIQEDADGNVHKFGSSSYSPETEEFKYEQYS